MANDNIIALADAVPVRALADHLRMHPVDVTKDLKSRGYALGSIRGAAGQCTKALTRNDAESISPSAVRPARHNHPRPVLISRVGPFVGDAPAGASRATHEPLP